MAALQPERPAKSFWNSQDFYSDFVDLFEYKTINLAEVTESVCKEGNTHDVYTGHFGDGRKYRRVFPHGKAEVWRNLTSGGDEKSTRETKADDHGDGRGKMWFVGFFGEQRPEVSHDTVKEVWEIDNILIKELANHPHIFFFGTCEMSTRKGDYFNLVLFNEAIAAEHWRGAYGHDRAVRISPHYYQEVRIHMGELTAGVRGNEFQPHRTTFLEYSGDTIKRHVRHWEDDTSNRIVVKMQN